MLNLSNTFKATVLEITGQDPLTIPVTLDLREQLGNHILVTSRDKQDWVLLGTGYPEEGPDGEEIYTDFLLLYRGELPTAKVTFVAPKSAARAPDASLEEQGPAQMSHLIAERVADQLKGAPIERPTHWDVEKFRRLIALEAVVLNPQRNGVFLQWLQIEVEQGRFSNEDVMILIPDWHPGSQSWQLSYFGLTEEGKLGGIWDGGFYPDAPLSRELLQYRSELRRQQRS